MNRRDFIAITPIGLIALSAAGQSASRKEFTCPPCGCPNDSKTFSEPGTCPICNMTLVDKSSVKETPGIINLVKVEDRVWTAGQPDIEQFANLQAQGVTTVINLRSATEGNNLGVAEQARLKELGIAYFNIPVVFSDLREAAVDEFLRITDQQMKSGRMLIHCAAAVRVAGLWMIRRVLRDGWSFDKALEEANRIGLGNQPQLIEFARQYIEKHRK
jgi:protein tyrosine phosphatase (PTP) superfamily phosphohydrolase (DUF442 family)